MTTTFSQRLAEAATLMRSGQGGTNEGLVCIAVAASDLVLVKDPTRTQTVMATDAWIGYPGNEAVTAYGLPKIP
jgi:hypothetical protein